MQTTYKFSAPAMLIASTAILATGLAAPDTALAQSSDQNFDGPFVGVEVGWERGSINGEVSTGTITVPLRNRKDGVSYGVMAGYDKQFDSFVIGGEVEFSPDGQTIQTPITNAGRIVVDPQWTLNVSARAGVTVTPRLLAYGRLGYARNRSRISGFANGQSAALASAKENIDGITYGGGLEYALSNGFSLRGEYRRTDYDGALATDRVLAGVSYRF